MSPLPRGTESKDARLPALGTASSNCPPVDSREKEPERRRKQDRKRFKKGEREEQEEWGRGEVGDLTITEQYFKRPEK